MTTPTTLAPPPIYLENAAAMIGKLTVRQYHRMIETGIYPEGEPIELLEGYLVAKMSRGMPHDNAMDLLELSVAALLSGDWFLRGQRAITLDDSEPEPDYAVVRGPRGRYRTNHPTPTDVALLIEVSDSSLRMDRVDKARIYARACIPVYWVVNVVDRQIEVFTQPSGPCDAPAYAKSDVYAVGTDVSLVIDGQVVGAIPVADVMA